MLRLALSLALVLALSSLALADDLILQDGRVLSGVTAAKEGETWVVSVPSVTEDGKARSHRIVLPVEAVRRHVTEKDEAGKKVVAAARKKEPSSFSGEFVVVTGRVAPHLGTHAVSTLDKCVRAFRGWLQADEKPLEATRVTVTSSDFRRSLRRARIVVTQHALEQILPKLAKAPFPIPALARLGGSASDGGLMEAVGAGKITDLTLDEAFRKAGRVEIGWSLVRYLNSGSGRWPGFLEVTRTGNAAAVRKWLDGIEGLEVAWREHVKAWSLTTPEHFVDAAYEAQNALRMRRAAALFATAIEKGTKEREAYDGLAEIYVLAGDSARAMRVWQAALTADPLNVRALRSAGAYLMEKRSARVGGLYMKMADDIEKALGE